MSLSNSTRETKTGVSRSAISGLGRYLARAPSAVQKFLSCGNYGSLRRKARKSLCGSRRIRRHATSDSRLLKGTRVTLRQTRELGRAATCVARFLPARVMAKPPAGLLVRERQDGGWLLSYNF